MNQELPRYPRPTPRAPPRRPHGLIPGQIVPLWMVRSLRWARRARPHEKRGDHRCSLPGAVSKEIAGCTSRSHRDRGSQALPCGQANQLLSLEHVKLPPEDH